MNRNNIDDFYLRDINLLTIFFGNEITLKEVRVFFFIKENPYCTSKEIQQFLGVKRLSSVQRPLGRLHKGYKNKQNKNGYVEGFNLIDRKLNPKFKKEHIWFINEELHKKKYINGIENVNL